MENFEKQPLKTRVQEAKEAILKSPEQIEAEFQRTANSWLECFGSRVFAVETFLFGQKAESELGAEKYKEVHEKLEALKLWLNELKERYPDKSTPPPYDIKQQLLVMLDVLK